MRTPHSEESKRRISDALKGRVFPHKNRPVSPETKLKIGLSLKGRKMPEGFGVGRVLSEETRRKISQAHKGMKHTEDTKKRLSEYFTGRPCPESAKLKKRMICGERSHAWKGGKVEEKRLARNRSVYREWRKSVFERDNYTCQMCKQRGCELNADHIKSFSQFPELRYVLENGRTLCVPCHKTTSNYGYKANLKDV